MIINALCTLSAYTTINTYLHIASRIISARSCLKSTIYLCVVVSPFYQSINKNCMFPLKPTVFDINELIIGNSLRKRFIFKIDQSPLINHSDIDIYLTFCRKMIRIPIKRNILKLFHSTSFNFGRERSV